MEESLKIFETTYRLIQQTIDDLVRLTASEKKRIHWAISGGSTPKEIFKALAEKSNLERINWEKVHFWWVDERCVGKDDPESNYGEANKLLLSHLDISEDQIHRVKGELSPAQAAIEYIHEIKSFVKEYDHGYPVFDLIWLGMGDDGHTASLFVECFSSSDQSWVTVTSHPKTGQSRITLTLPVINYAKKVAFIVTGQSKQQMLKTVISGSETSLIYPAANVKPFNGELIWYVDSQAAAKLNVVS
ncbi:6-phosphogluconolactonase [Thiotrichales bacterium 19S3-7]|nr:6-phosphogluconolactonase [Thiotrichales bacterium 19S3-7]MCF6802904.1 6-phosphogluconolactonase [Thiotrichales bacterium 19S3-11]